MVRTSVPIPIQLSHGQRSGTRASPLLSVPIRQHGPSRSRLLLLSLCLLATSLVLWDLVHVHSRKSNPKQIPNSRNSDSKRVHPGLSRSSEASSAEEPSEDVNRSSSGTPLEYRGAIWQKQVHAWLTSCWEKSIESGSPVVVTETLYGRSCPKGCSGNGVCNHELGECRCRLGYQGVDCGEDDVYECNKPAQEGLPKGPWVVSICPAHCDKRSSHCLCGSGKYPQRSLVEPCGFAFDSVTKAVKYGEVNTSLLYDPKWGYCNADADAVGEAYRMYEGCWLCTDGQTGILCSQWRQAYCTSQCSGHGTCHHGYCLCHDGFYGMDCGIPSTLTPPQLALNTTILHTTLPTANITQEATQKEAKSDMQGSVYKVQRRRPLIYIYDLPPEFTTHHLEGRNYVFHCAPWLYTASNMTDYNTGWLYSMEAAVIGTLLASNHRTLNAEEADYFMVPMFGGCITMRADDSPRMDMEKNFKTLRPYFTASYYERAYEHIRDHYPFWNRAGGKDHIWIMAWDEGACWAPKSIWNSILLSHWGNTMSKHKTSTTAYERDNWDGVPETLRGRHPCFDPLKDVVMPAFKSPSSAFLPHLPLNNRTKLFYFNGNLGYPFPGGRPEVQYSMGIRQKVAKYFASGTGPKEPKGINWTPGVVITGSRAQDYGMELASSVFCGVFPGDGFSSRMEDSMLHGCIPVIIQDGVQLPFESFLDYRTFAVRISEEDIPKMIDILNAISLEQVTSMLKVVHSIASRWSYRAYIAQEAEMQRRQGRETSGATDKTIATLKGDDAVDTLLQILGYKLQADHWRDRICTS